MKITLSKYAANIVEVGSGKPGLNARAFSQFGISDFSFLEIFLNYYYNLFSVPREKFKVKDMLKYNNTIFITGLARKSYIMRKGMEQFNKDLFYYPKNNVLFCRTLWGLIQNFGIFLESKKLQPLNVHYKPRPEKLKMAIELYLNSYQRRRDHTVLYGEELPPFKFTSAYTNNIDEIVSKLKAELKYTSNDYYTVSAGHNEVGPLIVRLKVPRCNAFYSLSNVIMERFNENNNYWLGQMYEYDQDNGDEIFAFGVGLSNLAQNPKIFKIFLKLIYNSFNKLLTSSEIVIQNYNETTKNKWDDFVKLGAITGNEANKLSHFINYCGVKKVMNLDKSWYIPTHGGIEIPDFVLPKEGDFIG